MRAWLLLLTVLATLLTLVQVASTENSSEPFSSQTPPDAISLPFEKVSDNRNIFSIEGATSFPFIGKHSEIWNKLIVNSSKDQVHSVVPSIINNNQLTVNKRYKQIVKMAANKIYKHPSLIKNKKDNNKKSNTSAILFEKLSKFPLKEFLPKNNHLTEVQRHREWITDKKKRRLHRKKFRQKLLKPSIKESARSQTIIYSGLNNNLLDMNLIKDTSSERTTNAVYQTDDFQQLDSKYALQTAQTSSEPRLHNSSSVIDFRISREGQNVKNAKSARKVFSDRKLSLKRYERPLKEVKSELNPKVQNEIKKSLLSLLKIDRPPVIDRSKIVIPKIMTQLYARKKYLDWNYVARSFTHKQSKIDERFPHHHKFRLYFDVHSIPAEEKLKAAELQLTRDLISEALLHPQLAYRTRYQVLVYDITRTGLKGKRPPKFLLLENKTVWLNSTEMVQLDVKYAVERWRLSPKQNYGLLVEVRTPKYFRPAPHHHVRLKRNTGEEEDQWRLKQPFLITYSDDGRVKTRSVRDLSTRSKRAGHSRRSHRRKNSDDICQRHPLYVDFSDVGWSDWIVAPPGYDAFYCQGKCRFPLADHLNSTNHAVVQTIVNNVNANKVPQTCCVPTQLEGHSFLYLNDQNTVVLKNYQDMAVVGCGCR